MLYAICTALALAALGLDQWVKGWTVANFAAPIGAATMTPDAPKPLWEGVVELTRVHNFGAAWSSFSGARWLLVAVTGVIILLAAYLLARRIVRHPLGVLAASLVIAGGLGNLLDRIRLGYVVDMFHFEFWPGYPVFNVADIWVICGAVLGAIYYLWIYEKTDRRIGKG